MIGRPESKRLELGEPGVAGLDDVGDAVQDPRSLARQHPGPRPLGERAPRGGDGAVDVGLLAGGGLQVGLVRDRVEHVERVAVRRVDELAVDVVLDAVGQVGGDVPRSHGCGVGHGCSSSECQRAGEAEGLVGVLVDHVGVEGRRAVAAGGLLDLAERARRCSMSRRMFSCSRTDSAARPGTKLKVESRRWPSRPHSASTSSSIRGFAHFEYRIAWNSLVERGERLRVEVVERLDHELVDRARATDVVGGEPAGRQRGRGALEDAERLHAVAVRGVVDHRHVRADVALERHEPLGLELADRLAHRHDAHVEVAGDACRARAGSPGVNSWRRCAP